MLTALPTLVQPPCFMVLKSHIWLGFDFVTTIAWLFQWIYTIWPQVIYHTHVLSTCSRPWGTTFAHRWPLSDIWILYRFSSSTRIWNKNTTAAAKKKSYGQKTGFLVEHRQIRSVAIFHRMVLRLRLIAQKMRTEHSCQNNITFLYVRRNSNQLRANVYITHTCSPHFLGHEAPLSHIAGPWAIYGSYTDFRALQQYGIKTRRPQPKKKVTVKKLDFWSRRRIRSVAIFHRMDLRLRLIAQKMRTEHSCQNNITFVQLRPNTYELWPKNCFWS